MRRYEPDESSGSSHLVAMIAIRELQVDDEDDLPGDVCVVNVCVMCTGIKTLMEESDVVRVGSLHEISLVGRQHGAEMLRRAELELERMEGVYVVVECESTKLRTWYLVRLPTNTQLVGSGPKVTSRYRHPRASCLR